mmetsp:Transcript_64124/g.119232  ORF Transcript_64124/g.119232 Transcript_64124/m.119232 type:complete len:951 (-) Transcript_64124:114-2966(-)
MSAGSSTEAIKGKRQAARDLAGVLLRVTQRKQVATFEALRWHSSSAAIVKLLRMKKPAVVPLVQRCKQATRELREQIAACQKACQASSSSDPGPPPASATESRSEAEGLEATDVSTAAMHGTPHSNGSRPVVPPLGAAGLLESLSGLATNGHLHALDDNGAPMISPAHPGPLRAAARTNNTAQGCKSGAEEAAAQQGLALAAPEDKELAGRDHALPASLAGSEEESLWRELSILSARLAEENPKWVRLFRVTKALEANHKTLRQELDAQVQAQPERRQRRSRGQGTRQDEATQEEVIFVGCSGQAPTMLISATGRDQERQQQTAAATTAPGNSLDRRDAAANDEAVMRKLDSNSSDTNGTKVIRHGTNSACISSTDKLAKAALAATTGQQPRVVRTYPGPLAQPQLQVGPGVTTQPPPSQRSSQQPKVPSVQISLLKELNAAQKVPIPGGVDWNLGLGDTESQTSVSSFSDDEGPLPDMAAEAARQGTPGPVANRAGPSGQLAQQGSASVLGGQGRMIGWSSVPDGLGRLATTVGESRQNASARTGSVGPAENQAATSMHTGTTMPRRAADSKVVANSASSGPIQSVGGGASTMWQTSPLYVPSTVQSMAPPRSSTGLKEEDRGDTKDSSFDSTSSALYTSLFGLNTPRQTKTGTTPASAGVPPAARASASNKPARAGVVTDRGSFGYRAPVSKQQSQSAAAPAAQGPSSAPPTPRQFLLGGGGGGGGAPPQPQPTPVQVVSGRPPVHGTTSLTSPRQVSVERAAPGDSRRSPTVVGPAIYGDSARLSAGAGRSPFVGGISQPTQALPQAERSPGSFISSLPCRPKTNMSAVAPAAPQPAKAASGCLPACPRDATANGMQLYTPRTTHPPGQQPGQQRPDAKQRAGGAARRDREISPDVSLTTQVPSGVATAMSLSPRSYTSLGLGATSSRGAPAPTAATSVPLAWHTRR